MSAFAKHCAKQAEACASLGSPFTARLCHLLGERMTDAHPVGARLLGWAALTADAVALRVAGGLHALAMADPGSALAAAYPPHVVDDATLWQVVENSLRAESGFMLDWLNSAPQTNEIRRCAGLIPAFHWLMAENGLPLRFSEIGASAGLNMNWEQYALHIDGQVWGPKDSPVQLRPKWHGALPPRINPEITNKAGCDLNPIDPQNPASRARLHAYIWPDQPERHAATSAALDMAKTTPEAADALAFLSQRLAQPRPGEMHVIYHSIVWQYLPEASQKACAARIKAAGEAATAETPVAWLSIEADHIEGGAAMRCTIWPGEKAYSLGRMDFHGRWVKWQPVQEPRTACSPSVFANSPDNSA